MAPMNAIVPRFVAVPHAPTPVSGGNETMTATVTISWEIKQ